MPLQRPPAHRHEDAHGLAVGQRGPRPRCGRRAGARRRGIRGRVDVARAPGRPSASTRPRPLHRRRPAAAAPRATRWRPRRRGADEVARPVAKHQARRKRSRRRTWLASTADVAWPPRAEVGAEVEQRLDLAAAVVEAALVERGRTRGADGQDEQGRGPEGLVAVGPRPSPWVERHHRDDPPTINSACQIATFRPVRYEATSVTATMWKQMRKVSRLSFPPVWATTYARKTPSTTSRAETASRPRHPSFAAGEPTAVEEPGVEHGGEEHGLRRVRDQFVDEAPRRSSRWRRRQAGDQQDGQPVGQRTRSASWCPRRHRTLSRPLVDSVRSLRSWRSARCWNARNSASAIPRTSGHPKWRGVLAGFGVVERVVGGRQVHRRQRRPEPASAPGGARPAVPRCGPPPRPPCRSRRRRRCSCTGPLRRPAPPPHRRAGRIGHVGRPGAGGAAGVASPHPAWCAGAAPPIAPSVSVSEVSRCRPTSWPTVGATSSGAGTVTGGTVTGGRSAPGVPGRHWDGRHRGPAAAWPRPRRPASPAVDVEAVPASRQHLSPMTTTTVAEMRPAPRPPHPVIPPSHGGRTGDWKPPRTGGVPQTPQDRWGAGRRWVGPVSAGGLQAMVLS